MATYDRRDLMREAAASAGEAQCAARSKQSGERCKKSPMPGSNVCRVHGGSAPQVKAAAKRRLEEASERMAQRLLGLAENDLKDGTKVGAYVQLGAVTAALDRAGIVEQKQLNVEVTAKPYENLLGDIESGSRADYRRSIGHPDPDPLSLPIAVSAPHRPGGSPDRVRVLGETFDGHAVIDGELVADDDQGEPEHAGRSGDPNDGSKALKQTLANPPIPVVSTQGGFLPAEDAVTQAAEANRAHRRQMRRR